MSKHFLRDKKLMQGKLASFALIGVFDGYVA